ncbi:TerD family protein [Thermonema rossianum]|uniref:TerD family protein n=1 Tax=Thermonema rossianum TaxID=55505 RepID=UPI00056E0215|nr:TerD family protein [Thermonema rossianum]
MAINLKKGGRFDLSKKEPALKKAMVGLGWTPRPGHSLDLDVSVFMVGANGKLPADEFFVFYNNLKSPDGAVQHTGDSRQGLEEGDDEIILVNLDLISPQVEELIFVVTIHDALSRGHYFGMLQDAYIRIVDVEGKREVLRYDLDEDFGDNLGMEFGRLQRQDHGWVFVASGIGSKQDLEGFVNRYA